MAAGRPAGALGQKVTVIDVADENLARCSLLLEMALQAERLIAGDQETLVDRAMRRVADDTALAQSFVLVNKWAALHGVTLETSVILIKEGDSTAFERLVHVGSAAFNRHTDMRVMTITTTHPAFEHWMMMRKLKLSPHFQVTLETCLGRLPRVDNGMCRAATFDVQTARSVT